MTEIIHNSNINLLDVVAQSTAQTSNVVENEYWTSMIIYFDIDIKNSPTVTLTLNEIAPDGTAIALFTGPAEGATGVKKYQIFPGAAVTATEKNLLLPRRFSITVTPQAVAAADTYNVKVNVR